eukprot:352312-Chlamydomonas_euryale.AAC.9
MGQKEGRREDKVEIVLVGRKQGGEIFNACMKEENGEKVRDKEGICCIQTSVLDVPSFRAAQREYFAAKNGALPTLCRSIYLPSIRNPPKFTP